MIDLGHIEIDSGHRPPESAAKCAVPDRSVALQSLIYFGCDKRTVSYWRFVGGTGGKGHHSKLLMRNVRCMQTLQSSILTRVLCKPPGIIQGT
jgi:hypothetical protein